MAGNRELRWASMDASVVASAAAPSVAAVAAVAVAVAAVAVAVAVASAVAAAAAAAAEASNTERRAAPPRYSAEDCRPSRPHSAPRSHRLAAQ